MSFLFVITPGADWAYAISAGLRYRTVAPAVGGLLAGHLVATGAVAAGVAGAVAGSPVVLTVLTVAGAVYLVWLGIGMITSPVAAGEAAEATAGASWVRQATKGLGISGLNPKVFLLFLVLLRSSSSPRRSGRWLRRQSRWDWCTSRVARSSTPSSAPARGRFYGLGLPRRAPSAGSPERRWW